MKRSFCFFVVFGFCMISSAFAQFENLGKITSKSECNRRCNISILKIGKYEAELLRLKEKHRDAKSRETDPEKLKTLEASQNNELEKFHQKCETTCEGICKHNPD